MVLSIVGQTHCVITQKNALIMVSCTDKTMKNKGLGNKLQQIHFTSSNGYIDLSIHLTASLTCTHRDIVSCNYRYRVLHVKYLDWYLGLYLLQMINNVHTCPCNDII